MQGCLLPFASRERGGFGVCGSSAISLPARGKGDRAQVLGAAPTSGSRNETARRRVAGLFAGARITDPVRVWEERGRSRALASGTARSSTTQQRPHSPASLTTALSFPPAPLRGSSRLLTVRAHSSRFMDPRRGRGLAWEQEGSWFLRAQSRCVNPHSTRSAPARGAALRRADGGRGRTLETPSRDASVAG